MYHNILPDLIFLRFYLAAHNRRTEIFGLMSNVSENLRSDFLAYFSFTGAYGQDDIVLLSVNPSGVYIVSDSRIAFYCC